VNRQHEQIERRLKENNDKLKLCTQLPHMVANVGEILEPEEDEEGGKDGSGFNFEKVGGSKKDDKK